MADSEIPDLYCDGVAFSQNAYGIALTFTLTPSTPPPGPGQPQPIAQAVIRMSLEHAKIMAMMIRRHLKQYELEHLGEEIRIPKALYQNLKLDEDSWK